MNDFFNSLNNSVWDSLYNLDLNIHKTKLKDSFVDNFIHELCNYMAVNDVKHKLSKIPEDTLLEINEIEDGYVQCYYNHEEYIIQNSMIYSKDLKGLENDGYIRLQLQDDGLYHVIRTK